MSQDLYEAYKQWSTRPHDERFESLDALHSFCVEKRANSTEFAQPLNQLKVRPNDLGELVINGSYEPLTLTNWSFGQLARFAQAPASYLRTLPTEMSASCLQYGLDKSGNTESKLLIHKHNETNRYFASAFTSATYGRIWDYVVLDELTKITEDNSWNNPKDTRGNPSGLYASDRDMFVFMVNEQNTLKIGNNNLKRGFFLWNSEVGSKSFGFTTFLYNSMCANHLIWDADQVNKLKIYHRNKAFNRFYMDALPVISEFVDNNYISNTIKEDIERAMETKLGENLSDITKRFKNKDFTQKEITASYETAQADGEDPHTLWGMIQGLTSHAKSIPYIDKRVNLEKRAGALLNR